jgi:GAG-pre-integrase domain
MKVVERTFGCCSWNQIWFALCDQVKMCGEVNVSECNSTDLWHLRLCHMSEKGIKIISKKNYVPSYGTSLTSYTHYLAGKQYRVAFKKI